MEGTEWVTRVTMEFTYTGPSPTEAQQIHEAILETAREGAEAMDAQINAVVHSVKTRVGYGAMPKGVTQNAPAAPGGTEQTGASV